MGDTMISAYLFCGYTLSERVKPLRRLNEIIKVRTIGYIL